MTIQRVTIIVTGIHMVVELWQCATSINVTKLSPGSWLCDAGNHSKSRGSDVCINHRAVGCKIKKLTLIVKSQQTASQTTFIL